MALSAEVGGVGLVCRQRREQRLRLGDRGKQWCRREACERRREHCVRIGATAVRSVELGERKGSKQLVAPRALFLRDDDGGLKRLLGERRVGGVALEQGVAPQARRWASVKRSSVSAAIASPSSINCSSWYLI
jgi:hypothetical protein